MAAGEGVKVNVADPGEVDVELLGWIRMAYDASA